MDNPFEEIPTDLGKPRESKAGLIQIASANETLELGKREPDPVDLYQGLFGEGDLACLFSDTGLGKSIFATQIGESIAKTQPVLYLDCELTRKQFQLRYTGDNGTLHIFPEHFYRAELIPDASFVKNFEDKILHNIELAAKQVNAKVLIIDNLTYLCNASEKSEDASIFMKKLKEMQSDGFTILVIAHTPKRSLYYPLTDCDLAGSRRLANFFDTVFAIGRSAKDSSLRYIKQVKASRIAPEKYSSDNVMVCQLIKDDTFALRLETVAFEPERAHLKVPTEEEIANREVNVKLMHSQGVSYRDIAKELGISKSSVCRIINDKDNG